MLRRRATRCLAACLLAAALLLPAVASAQTQSTTCSTDQAYNVIFPVPGSGVISQVVCGIQTTLTGANPNCPNSGGNGLVIGMYNGILANQDFQDSAAVVMTLYVIIYGLMFMAGLTQVSLHEAVVRVVKIGIVAAILVPGTSWSFFYNYLGIVFDQGKNELIGVMLNIGVGGMGTTAIMDPNNIGGVESFSSIGLTPQALAAYPFSVLDDIIAVLTSSKMAITWIATLMTGPYGIIIGLLIFMGLGSFVGALFQAMWVYLMSVVVTAFLFALAPIFFVFILFQRTRPLFDGWLNQLISATLQPVMLFAFFSFFCAMMFSSITQLLQTPVCWTPPGDLWRGTPFNIYVWRFEIPVNGSWMMYNGAFSFTGPDVQGVAAPTFPIGIANVLCLVLIAQLSKRFNSVVLHIAREIAGAAMQLELGSRLGSMFSPQRMGDGMMNKLFGERSMGGKGAQQSASRQFRSNAANTGQVGKRTPPGKGGNDNKP